MYRLGKNERQAIVLNPTMKDKDYLIIEVMNAMGLVWHKFTYEIDSLKKKVQQGNDLRMFIVTKLSGNLRFIHLMTMDQYMQEDKQSEEPEIEGDEEGEERNRQEEEKKDGTLEIPERNPDLQKAAFSFYKNRGEDQS